MANEMPLAGRREELDSLVAVLARHRRGAVLVLGEAGVGKTRLVASAAARVADFDVTVFTGSCLRLSDGLPFLPLLDVFRNIGELDDGGFIKAVVGDCPAFVQAELCRLVPDKFENPAATVGSGPDDAWRKQRLFEALRQVLAAASALRGLAIVIEDVHWADDMTVAFLDYLLAGARAVDVPILITCRDDAEPGGWRDEWLDRMNRNDLVQRVDLAPMTEAETAEHIELLVGSAPSPERLRGVYRRSEGNPFFTEQLVMAAYTDGHGDVLPRSLTTLLLSRVGRIDGVASEVLAALAVAEQPLDEAELRQLTGLTHSQVRETLRGLMARRLLRKPDAAGRHQLRHALLGQAIIEDLLPSERSELHARVAPVIAARGDPSAAAAVAQHFQSARLPAEELTWRIRAGRHAEAVAAAKEAAQHWRRALELSAAVPADETVDGMSLAELYGAAEDALLSTGDEDGARALAEEALSRLRDIDPGSRADVLRRAGTMYGRSEPTAGLRLLQDALDILEQLPTTLTQAYTLVAIARIHHNEGHLTEGSQFTDRVESVAAQLGEQRLQREMHATQAWYLYAAGHAEEALAQIRPLQREALGQDDPTHDAYIALFHAAILMDAGRLVEVEAAVMPTLVRAANYGLQKFDIVALARKNLTEPLIELGLIDAAMRVVEPLTDQPAVARPGSDFEARATLEALMGNFTESRERWAELHRLPPKLLRDQVSAAVAESELDLWTGRAADVFQRCADLLRHDDVLLAQEGRATLLLVTALRACADIADTARAHQDQDLLRAAIHDRDGLVELHARAASRPSPLRPVTVTARAEELLWQAEISRAEGTSSAELWHQAAAAWEHQQRPHRAAYARWRQAEALLSAAHTKSIAADALTSAHRQAAQHAPLLHAIEDLAFRARLDLNHCPQPTERDTSTVIHPFELTDRELAVLRLLGQGKTNPEIAASLYISAKTASVHVTHILRKLNAATRVQAATLAQRAGLLD